MGRPRSRHPFGHQAPNGDGIPGPIVGWAFGVAHDWQAPVQKSSIQIQNQNPAGSFIHEIIGYIFPRADPEKMETTSVV